MGKRLKKTIKPKGKGPTAAEVRESIKGVSPVVIAAIMGKEDMATEPVLQTSYANGARSYEEYIKISTGRDPLPREQVKKLLDEQTGAQRTWVMPDNSPEAKALRASTKIEEQKRRIFAANEDAPVTVVNKDDEGPKTIAVYQNMEDFRTKHDFATYPFKESRGDKEQTVILVGAKPWAGREPKVGAVPRPAGKTKAEMIGEMLLRPEGVTSKEVCTTMGWPSVSMPNQAKMCDLTLRKEKIDGVTRYWGIKK